MANRNMRPGCTAASRALTLGLLSLLAAACVRHLPVVGETEGQSASSKAGASGRASAGASARRAASEQSSASAGSNADEQDEASSEPAAPSGGKSGSKPAAAGSARAEAGSAAPAKSGNAGAGAADPEAANMAKAGSGAAPSSPPSSPSIPAGTPSAGTGWYCAQANNVCSCVEGSGVSGDTCTSHPSCCFEATNGTTYRSCFCVAEGSPECMAYLMAPAQQQQIKKASSCPL